MQKKNKSALIWLWGIAKKQLPLMILLTVSAMVMSVCYVIPALLCRSVINTAVAAQEGAVKTILRYGLWLIAFVIAELAVTVANSHLRAVISGRMEMDLRHHIFETVTRKEYPSISRFHSGDILNRFTSDVDIVVSGVTTFIPQALSILAKITAGFVVIASFNVRFAVAIVALGLLVLGAALTFKPLFKKSHREVQQASGTMRAFAQECVENIVVVKSFSTRQPLLKKLDQYMRTIYKKQLFRTHVGNFGGAGASFLFSGGYYAALCWGAIMIAGGSMDYGTLMAFMQIVSQLTTPFYGASSLLTQFYSAIASAERILELSALPDEVSDETLDAKALYKKTDAFVAEGLRFGYGEKEIIKPSSFTVKKGSIAVITGLSGTGKSTLFKLLLGLYAPKDGALYLKCDQESVPITAALRPLFAYVPQGNLLLSGTLSENIKFVNPDLSEEQMKQAAKIACIDDFIESLPDGFETVIGERGIGLSEGQIQRISIARALCSDAPVLLLDECTSALDSETEERLLQNIAALHTKTVFFISHKNAALSVCNLHLQMEDGVFKTL